MWWPILESRGYLCITIGVWVNSKLTRGTTAPNSGSQEVGLYLRRVFGGLPAGL
jgi:hypothetical protein